MQNFFNQKIEGKKVEKCIIRKIDVIQFKCHAAT